MRPVGEWSRKGLRVAALVGALFLGGFAAPARQALAEGQASSQKTAGPPAVPTAQQTGQPAAQPQPAQPPVGQPQKAAPEQAEGPETLHVLVGRSLVVTSPTPLKRVSIADPNVADAVVVSPTQVVVNGKAPGAVSLVLWDESGQSQTFEVLVELDILDLQQKIHDAFPNEPIQVEASKDVLLFSGHVSSPAVADKVLELGKARTPKVVSLLEVPSAPAGAEILLEVKFAEVDLTALTQLGVNILSLPPAKNIGAVSTQQFGPPQLSGQTIPPTGGGFTVGDILNVFLFRPDINLAATIKALQTQNVLQILAEPNVLTESGKEASFLAGGEFPFPVIQPSAGGVPLVTIQFRPFGVMLNFAPTLAPDGTIHLKVKPEVSSLDFTNAVTISGFLIPALSTRRVESEMDLQDGQSFAIAGLMDNRVQKQLSKIPGIGDIPVLGKLFQSESLQKSKDELLVLVTPRIVKPSPLAPLPAEPRFPVPFLPPFCGPGSLPAGCPAAAPKTAPAPGGR